MSAKNIIKGTIIFTVAGLFCRIMGFVFRIYISRIMPASQIGLYQVVLPVSVLGQSIAVGGLSTAVSKYTAAYRAQSRKDKGFLNFLATLLFSFLISVVIALFTARNADFIALHIIRNPVCSRFIIIAAYSLPFASLHSIISSYFVGLELPGIPAAAQIIEQLVRIGCVFTFSGICAQNGTAVDASVVLYGILAGEIGSSLFTFVAVIFLKDKYKTEETGLIRTPVYYFAEGIQQLGINLKLAMPITANRACLHLIQSLEAVLLPMMLMVHGRTNEEALSVYGVLTGMTMPLLLFPATITNAMSQALLPDISRSWQTGNRRRLDKSISFALKLAMNLGILCIPGYFFYGARFGQIIFDNPDVAVQIRLMCLMCPLVFLSTPLSASLNAIGKSGSVLLSNLCSHLVCLALVVFVVPRIGINGYCIGSIVSHFFVCLWQMACIKKATGCRYSFKGLIAAPVIKNIICFFATFPVYCLVTRYTPLPELACLIIGGAAFGGASVLAGWLWEEK